jgi:hypothetical protein
MDLCQEGEMVNFTGLMARIEILLMRSLEPQLWLGFLALEKLGFLKEHIYQDCSAAELLEFEASW